MNVVALPQPLLKSHMEQHVGEQFLGYFKRAGFNAIAWKTKREGQVYLNDEGEIIGQGGILPDQRFFPVFVKRREVEEHRRRESGL